MSEAATRLVSTEPDLRPFLPKPAALSPVAAALAYPFLLSLFHWLNPLSRTAGLAAGLLGNGALLAAILVPILALLIAAALGHQMRPSEFELQARRLAFLSMTAPPLFVLFGVGLGLLRSPVRDVTAWTLLWSAALLVETTASDRPAADAGSRKPSRRVLHGATAAILSLFILFHLGNHLTGLLGPDAHARVMALGRNVYRLSIVEPILVGLLALQLINGGRLAWSWTRNTGDLHRTIQIGSGIYIGAFVVTHLNSALVSARLVRGLPTDWAWASGAPEGLLFDAWNIPLVPHTTGSGCSSSSSICAQGFGRY